VSELLLIVIIAGERVALPSTAVESVVELDTLLFALLELLILGLVLSRLRFI
jgi:hypothetical protein